MLTQRGIDFYNMPIGGIAGKLSRKQTQGLNQKINLTRQQLFKEEKSKLRGKITMLSKQGMNDRETFSFIPEHFSDEQQVYKAIKIFYEANAEPALQALSEPLAASSDFDAARISVSAWKQTDFSHTVLGDWALLGGE